MEVAPLFDGARFFWAVPGYVPADVASALPDLTRPEVLGRMATLVVQGTTPGAGLTMRSQQLVRDYGLDEAGWSHEIGDLQAIIRTVDERIAAGDWFVTPLWQPQYLNDVHDLRPLDDPRGVFPPPDRASLIAHRDSFDRLPGRTRDVLRRIRFTVADVNAMDGAVNLDGLDPLAAARDWMDRHPDDGAGLARPSEDSDPGRPMHPAHTERRGEAAMKLYDKALVTVDQMGNKLTRDRIREFCSLNCKEVFICYIAPEHIIAGEVGHSLAVGEHGGDAEVTQEHVAAVQEYVDLLAAEGIEVHGQIITAAEYDRGDAIVSLAQQLGVDLTILNFEIGGARPRRRSRSRSWRATRGWPCSSHVLRHEARAGRAARTAGRAFRRSASAYRVGVVTLAEDLYLLADDPATGRPLVDVAHLDLGLGGALLLDLALRQRIAHTDELVKLPRRVRPASRCWTVPWLPSRSRAAARPGPLGASPRPGCAPRRAGPPGRHRHPPTR